MPRPKRTIKSHGITLTSEGWAKKYGINTACFLERINKGWKMQEGVMVAPNRKEYERGVNLQASFGQCMALKTSFIGDCPDDGIDW